MLLYAGSRSMSRAAANVHGSQCWMVFIVPFDVGSQLKTESFLEISSFKWNFGASLSLFLRSRLLYCIVQVLQVSLRQMQYLVSKNSQLKMAGEALDDTWALLRKQNLTKSTCFQRLRDFCCSITVTWPLCTKLEIFFTIIDGYKIPASQVKKKLVVADG